MLLLGHRNDASPRIKRLVCYEEHANCGEGPGAAETRCRCVRYAPPGHPEPRDPTRPASGGGATPWHVRRRSPGSPITGELARVVACESMIRAWCADPGSSADGALSSWRRVDHEGHRPPGDFVPANGAHGLAEGGTGGAGPPTRSRARPDALPPVWTHESSTQRQRTAPRRGHPARPGARTPRPGAGTPRPGAGTPRDVGGRTAHPARPGARTPGSGARQ